MITLQTRELEPGYIVAQDIITRKGQIIAPAGTELSKQLIGRLSFYRIDSVTVEDPIPAEELLDGDELIAALELLAPSEEEPEEKKEEPPKDTPQKEEPPKEKEVINDTISYSNRLKAAPEYQEFQIDYSKALVALENTFTDIIENNGANYSRSGLLQSIEPLYRSKTSLDI